MPSSTSVQGASVTLQNIVRTYGEVRAVDGVSLDVEPGEFVTLLGPSGSGKTTSLNIVAGFEQATSGQVLVDGKPITGLPAHKRNMGMVFQNYALFPHMTAAENIAFPLKERKVSRANVAVRVQKALELVRLGGFGDRSPAQLSGGQQQRIALARSIVYSPQVLLMDEPLGALDKKLRSWLQEEIKRIHHELRTTVLFVTHDQDEALALSDRIALFRDGRIVQVGTPEELWNRPETPFVADFLGESNLIRGILHEHDGFAIAGNRFAVAGREELALGAEHTLLVRPENVAVTPDHESARANKVPGIIGERMFMGSTVHLRIDSALGPLRALTSVSAGTIALATGERVWASWDPADSRVLRGVDDSIHSIGDDPNVHEVEESPAA